MRDLETKLDALLASQAIITKTLSDLQIVEKTIDKYSAIRNVLAGIGVAAIIFTAGEAASDIVKTNEIRAAKISEACQGNRTINASPSLTGLNLKVTCVQ
jgi:hypothetical protein